MISMLNPNEAASVDCFQVSVVDWHSARMQLSAIRTEVFIQEQHVPAELEWDEFDQKAQHLLALDSTGQAIGCARIVSPGSIGRMAVLAGWRHQGIGSALLRTAIDICRENGWSYIRLSAQIHAIGFYEKTGFTICSEEYFDAGIPHQDMHITLLSK